jgi:hypothetical protein
MSPMRMLVTGAAVAALHACTQQATRNRSAGGDIDVAAFTASRTVLVRVQNSYPTRVQVFTVIGDKNTELTNVATDGVQTVALDPSLFPGTLFSLEIVPVTGPSKRLGPFRLSKGQTANLIITPNLDSARVDVRPSTP